MATIIVEGNLAKDLEVRVSEAGNVWITGRLMENFSKRNDDSTYTELRPLGYDFVAFGSQAANAAETFIKGSRVRIEGRLEPHDFRKEDGEMFRGERIVVTSITPSLRFATAQLIKTTASDEPELADAEASQAQ